MSIGERLRALDLGELLPSFLLAGLAIGALMLLTDRFQRVAKSAPADRSWSAPTGNKLRLMGLHEGPLLGIETSPGGGLTARAERAALVRGGPERPLIWMAQGDSKGDNKAKVEIGIVGKGGTVVLTRSGEAEIPQVRIRVIGASLGVDAGVTVGESLTIPVTRAVFNQEDLPPKGPGFSFIVPAGETIAIEFPDAPNGQPSGVVTSLGAVREDEQDTLLPLSEVAIAEEDATTPDRAACAADRRYAWAPFFRPTLFPVPTGRDCKAGILTARSMSISNESVGISLAGKVWEMKDGMPIASFWSWATGNPVLSILINKILPGAVGLALGLITWRRASASRASSKERKGSDGPDDKPAARTGRRPSRRRRA